MEIDAYLKQADAEFARSGRRRIRFAGVLESIDRGPPPYSDGQFMKVRFQADADLNEILVKALLRREPEIDVQTLGRRVGGLADSDVLALAARSAACS